MSSKCLFSNNVPYFRCIRCLGNLYYHAEYRSALAPTPPLPGLWAGAQQPDTDRVSVMSMTFSSSLADSIGVETCNGVLDAPKVLRR